MKLTLPFRLALQGLFCMEIFPHAVSEVLSSHGIFKIRSELRSEPKEYHNAIHIKCSLSKQKDEESHMFKKFIARFTNLFISGSATFYMRVFLLTLVLIASLALSGTALAFGPMPGNVGG